MPDFVRGGVIVEETIMSVIAIILYVWFLFLYVRIKSKNIGG